VHVVSIILRLFWGDVVNIAEFEKLERFGNIKCAKKWVVIKNATNYISFIDCFVWVC